jgi:hypothetical protein
MGGTRSAGSAGGERTVRHVARERWPAVCAGIALLGLMAVHVIRRPEHAWVLLATCDVAALATAAGLLFGWERWLGAAFVFQMSIGMPAFAVGLCTTYPTNITGVAIHVVPPILGAAALAGRALPPRSAVIAWLGYVVTILLTYAVSPPPEFNINFTAAVWPPMARLFSSRAPFFAGLFAVAAVMLCLGALALGRVFRAPVRR